MLASEALADGERGQASVSVRFTAVNGANSNSTFPRTTSFRPDHVQSIQGYHQHLMPKQHGPTDQPSTDHSDHTDYTHRMDRHGTSEQNTNVKEHQIAYHHPQQQQQQPAALPQSRPQTQSQLPNSPNQQHNLGKRKRSVDVVVPSSSPNGKGAQATPFDRPNLADSTNMQPGNRDVGPPAIFGNTKGADSNGADMSQSQYPSEGSAGSNGGLDGYFHERLPLRESQSRADESDDPTDVLANPHQHNKDDSQAPLDELATEFKMKPYRKRNFSQRTKTGCQYVESPCYDAFTAYADSFPVVPAESGRKSATKINPPATIVFEEIFRARAMVLRMRWIGASRGPPHCSRNHLRLKLIVLTNHREDCPQHSNPL